MKLVFDTETTGFTRDRLPPGDKAQPHLVQLGAVLCEDSGLIVHQVSLLIAAEDWEVEHGAANVHGFTTERTRKYGIPEKAAVAIFFRLLERADELIAHNLEFDRKVMNYAFHRYGGPDPIEQLGYKHGYCTMLKSTNHCCIPHPRGGMNYKWPKLEEAYLILLGKTIKAAQQALPDCLACWELWMRLTGRDTPTPLELATDHNALLTTPSVPLPSVGAIAE